MKAKEPWQEETIMRNLEPFDQTTLAGVNVDLASSLARRQLVGSVAVAFAIAALALLTAFRADGGSTATAPRQTLIQQINFSDAPLSRPEMVERRASSSIY
jgi:hypothetical protein